MTTTDRRDATDAQFADELARLDRLDVADESAVERVARAIADDGMHAFAEPGWGDLYEDERDVFRRYARAAIDALKPAPGTEAAGPTVQRDHSPGHCVSVEDANRVLAETRGSTEDALHRVLDLADELAEPIFRAAVLLPEREMGRQEGEDSERRRIAARIRSAVAGPQRNEVGE